MASLSITMSKRQKWNWKKTYGILILSAAFFTITMPLQAALLQERQYSLRQLIAFALEYNRSIQAAKYKLNASDWNVKKAYSEFLPNITLSQRFTRNDNISVRNANFAIDGLKSFPGFEDVDIPPLLFKNTFTSGFTVLMPIYNGGRLSSTLEVSIISRESDRLSVIDTEAEIKRQVTGMYFNYVKNRELIKVAERIARSSFLPDINFAYSYAWQDNDTPELDGFRSWNATVKLSYALFNGFHDLADLQRSRAETRQIQTLEENIERSILVSLYTVLNTIKSSLARITLSEKNLVHTGDNLKSIQSRYNLGLASNIDLIDAQVLETTAQVD